MNTSRQELDFFLSSRFATHRYPINTATIITLYSTIAVIGFIENAIIFGALLTIGDMRHGTAANVFVGALTVSDMILCVFNVPTQLYYELGEPSEMSTTSCRILFACLGVPTHVSCILIFLIAIERYRTVRFPTFVASGLFSKSLQPATALLLVMGSLVFSLLAAFPVAYYTHVQEVSPKGLQDNENISVIGTPNFEGLKFTQPAGERHFPKYCVEVWPSPLYRLIYSICVTIGQFLTPLIVTLILYAHIGLWFSRRRSKLFNVNDRVDSKPGYIKLTARIEARNRRTHRILVGIVACFAGCWTPWNLYSLYLECTAYIIGESPVDETSLLDPGNQNVAVDANVKTTDLVLKLFALSSTCANPFLYGWLNENIRKSIIRRTGLWVKKRSVHN